MAKIKTIKVEEAVVAPVVENTTSKATKVVFTRKDGTTREFTKEIHGADFVAIADEFAVSNAKFIADRVEA